MRKTPLYIFIALLLLPDMAMAMAMAEKTLPWQWCYTGADTPPHPDCKNAGCNTRASTGGGGQVCVACENGQYGDTSNYHTGCQPCTNKPANNTHYYTAHTSIDVYNNPENKYGWTYNDNNSGNLANCPWACDDGYYWKSEKSETGACTDISNSNVLVSDGSWAYTPPIDNTNTPPIDNAKYKPTMAEYYTNAEFKNITFQSGYTYCEPDGFTTSANLPMDIVSTITYSPKTNDQNAKWTITVPEFNTTNNGWDVYNTTVNWYYNDTLTFQQNLVYPKLMNVAKFIFANNQILKAKIGDNSIKTLGKIYYKSDTATSSYDYSQDCKLYENQCYFNSCNSKSGCDSNLAKQNCAAMSPGQLGNSSINKGKYFTGWKIKSGYDTTDGNRANIDILTKLGKCQTTNGTTTCIIQPGDQIPTLTYTTNDYSIKYAHLIAAAESNCPAGYYCPGEFKCNAANENTTTADGKCPCPAGYYCQAGVDTPTVCSAGYHCPQGSSNQTKCPAGYYCPGTENDNKCTAQIAPKHLTTDNKDYNASCTTDNKSVTGIIDTCKNLIDDQKNTEASDSSGCHQYTDDKYYECNDFYVNPGNLEMKCNSCTPTKYNTVEINNGKCPCPYGLTSEDGSDSIDDCNTIMGDSELHKTNNDTKYDATAVENATLFCDYQVGCFYLPQSISRSPTN